MASVVAQTLALNYAGRYRPCFLPITQNSRLEESFSQRLFRHLKQFKIIHAEIKANRIPLVHLHTCSGWSFLRSGLDLMLIKAMGCRVVLHLHGGMFDSFYARQPWWRRWLIQRTLTWADAVIALSQSWKEKLRTIASQARIHIVENAVQADGNMRRARESDQPCHFLLLAGMDHWKGIDDLLDACQLLLHENVKFSLTLAGPPGTAGDRDELNRKITKCNISDCVQYVGSVRGEAKETLLHQVDAYVQPSHHEGMPIAMLEALASGLPIVATRVGAVGEVITDGREGLLVPPHNPLRLAEAMRKVATQPDLRDRMAESSRHIAQARFSLGRLENNLLQLYDVLLTPYATSTNAKMPRATPHHAESEVTLKAL